MKPAPFDKYELYVRSVQDPLQTLIFLDEVYRKAFRQEPLQLCEDFGGTFALSCTWVERSPRRKAFAVDLDPTPLHYGIQNFARWMTEEQRSRLRVFEDDVRNSALPKSDIIAALNFSYFGFKQRCDLREYFKNCLRRLNKNGMLVLDAFGGPDTEGPSVKQAAFPGFTYFWEQTSFDPRTREAEFYIHYARDGEKKRTKVFHYHWRMWSLPELSDLMVEVGFALPEIYWQRLAPTDGKASRVYRKPTADDLTGWLVYLVVRKGK